MRVSVQVRRQNTSTPTATAISRYFSIRASPRNRVPLMPMGSSSRRCSGPQNTLISSSPMMAPPTVMRICFRWLPYTGRTIQRSNSRPPRPAAAIASPIAGSTAARLRHSSVEAVHSGMRPSTDRATKAPSAMNTPWPKFSTSIRPNTRVRPEAMMKMIMPIARPATVSVTQVEPEPMKGNTRSNSKGTSASGFQSKSRFFISPAPAASAAALRPRPVPSSRPRGPRRRCPSRRRCRPGAWRS